MTVQSTILIMLLALPSAALGQVHSYVNDYAGFLDVTGEAAVIDFETLPNGSPSIVGTPITASFNYDGQGAHFTGMDTVPIISGNPVAGYGLRAGVENSWERTWVIADLMAATNAVGVFVPVGTRLCAFAADGLQLGCVAYFAPLEIPFIGLVAEQRIAQVVINRGGPSQTLLSFHYSRVPEPTCVALLCVFVATRRRRAARAVAG